MPLRWRADADHVPDVPHVRRIMPYIMRTRSESTVYFEQKIDVTRTQPFLERFRAETGLHATLTHLMIWGIARTLEQRPRLNRFIAGGRLWQRRGIWVSFSGKKAKSDEKPLITLKRRVDPRWTFEQVVRDVERAVGEGRSDKESHTDKELKLFFHIPHVILWVLAKVIMRLDAWGMLPAWFIEGDPLFASVFLANLGTIDMDASYHHLFEYGSIPIFVLAGRARPELVVNADGSTEVRPLLTLKYTLDERVEDGLYCARSLAIFKAIVEDPEGAGAGHRDAGV